MSWFLRWVPAAAAPRDDRPPCPPSFPATTTALKDRLQSVEALGRSSGRSGSPASGLEFRRKTGARHCHGDPHSRARGKALGRDRAPGLAPVHGASAKNRQPFKHVTLTINHSCEAKRLRHEEEPGGASDAQHLRAGRGGGVLAARRGPGVGRALHGVGDVAHGFLLRVERQDQPCHDLVHRDVIVGAQPADARLERGYCRCHLGIRRQAAAGHAVADGIILASFAFGMGRLGGAAAAAATAPAAVTARTRSTRARKPHWRLARPGTIF